MREIIAEEEPVRIPDPIDELKACHGRIRLRLDTIAGLLDRLPDEPDTEELTVIVNDVIAFFDSSVVRHTRDEEEIVFPVLADRVDRAMVARLHAEHVEHETLLAQVRRAADAVLAGDGREPREALKTAFARLRTAYVEHMRIEEEQLFPQVQLTAEERDRLGKALLESRAFRLQVKGRS